MATGTTFTIKLNAETAEAISKFLDFFGKVGGMVKEFAPQLALAGSLTALADKVSEAIKVADEMGKAAQRVGIAVAELSTLSLAARLADVDMATLATSIRGLDKVIGEAVNENSQAAISFRTLGVSLRDSNGNLRTTDDILKQLADGFAKLPDGVTKTRLATELFGRSGMSLIPLLNQGRRGIEEAQEEARIFGLRVGPEFAENAERYRDNLTRIKAIFEGMYMTLAEALLPELLRLTDAIVDFVKQSGAHMGIVESLIDVYRILAKDVAGVVFSFEALGSFLGSFAGALYETGNPFEAWTIASETFLQKCDQLVARLNQIDALGTKMGEGKARNIQTSEDPVDAHNRSVATFNEEDKRLQLMLKENELITKKFQAEVNMDPVGNQRRLNEQLQIEINLIQKHRQLTANAFQSGTINRDQYRQFEISDKGKLFDAAKRVEPTTFGGDVAKQFSAMVNQWGTVAHQMATTFTSTIGTAISSISDNLTGVIMKTKTWGQALLQIGNTILTAVIHSFVEMGVRWLMTHVFMAGISKAFHATETATQTAATTTQVAIHSTGEAAKTGSTSGGVIARGALRVAETVFHGVQVGIRMAAHLAAEIFMTAMTVAQSAIRIVSIVAETAVSLVQAAIKAMSAVANIPYVGPILAIAALGAILAAGAAAMGAFEEGGYTGSGGSSEPAGIVHRGEYVFSAPSVNRIGLGNLEAMHSGRGSSAAAGPGGGNTVNIGVINDRADIPNWVRSQQGEAHVVDIVKRNWHRLT